jgi:hypothetical protein
MGKLYDKIIFAIGLLVLGVGVYFYLSAEAPDAAPVSIQYTGGAYEPVPVPDLPRINVDWEPPPETTGANEGWDYQVFTPPFVWIDNGILIPRPPERPVPPPAFGIDLVSGPSRELYRLQYEGYLEMDPEDITASIILMVATETGESIRVEVGETNEQYDFEVLDFSEELVTTEDGIIERRQAVEIRDLRTGRNLTLSSEEPLYASDIELAFASTINPEQRVSLEVNPENPTATWQMNDATYTLQEIFLDQKRVRVKKESDALENPVVRTLSRSPNPDPNNLTTPANETGNEATPGQNQAPRNDGGFPEDFNF